MNLRTTIVAAILEVAADLDATELDELAADADFRDELDLDSMDFLNVLVALKATTGVEIPEADYPRVRSLAGLEAYLRAHGAGAPE